MSHSAEIDWQESLPDCPECGHNVFVRAFGKGNDWKCEGCSTTFDAPRKPEWRVR